MKRYSAREGLLLRSFLARHVTRKLYDVYDAPRFAFRFIALSPIRSDVCSPEYCRVASQKLIETTDGYRKPVPRRAQD